MASPITLTFRADYSGIKDIGAQLGASIRSGVDEANRAINQLNGNIERLRTGGGGLDFVSGKLTGLSGLMDRVSNSFLRFAGMTYIFERMGTAIERGLVSPFEAAAMAGDRAMRFRQQISGTVGGMDTAGGIDRSIINQLSTIPMTLEQTRRVTEELSKVGALSGAFSIGTPDQVSQRVAGYAQTVGNLQSLAPWLTPETVAHQIGAALEGGNLGRLSRQLGINPSDLGHMSGMSTRALSNDPSALMDALSRFANTYGPGAVGASRGQLAGVSWEKLKDDGEIALEKISQSGLWDQIVNRVQTVGTTILQYLNSNQFAGRAAEISKGMGNVLDGLGESALRLIQGLSGAKDLAGTPDAVAGQIAGFTKTIGDWSRDLPGITASVGRGLHTVIDDLGSLGDALHVLIHPIDALRNATGKDSDDAIQQRYGMIVARMGDMGLTGATVDRMKINQLAEPSSGDAFADAYVKGWTRGTGPLGVNSQGQPLDMTGNLEGVGPLQVNTAGIQSPAQRLLAEQMFQSLQNSDISGLGNVDEVKWKLRQSIPGFDDRLRQAQNQTLVSGSYKLPPGLAAQINDIPHDVLEPNYSTKFRGTSAMINELSGWDDSADKLAALFHRAQSTMTELAKGEDGQDMFGRVTQWRNDSTSQVRSALGAVQQQIIADPDHGTELGDRASALSDAMNKLTDRYAAEMDSLAEQLVGRVGSFGVELAQNVKKAGSTYAADVMQAFAEGRTQIQQQAAALLQKHGYGADLGLAMLPLDQRQPFVDQMLSERLSSIKDFNVGTPAHDSMMSMLAGRQSTSQQDAAAMQTALGYSQQNYMSAQMALRSNPSDPAATQAMDQSAAAVAKLSGEIQQLQAQNNSLAQSFIAVGNSAQNSLSGGLAKALTDVETRTGNVRAAMSALAKEMLSEFNNIEIKSMFSAILGPTDGQSGAGHGAGGILGGLASGLTNGISHLFGPSTGGADFGGLFGTQYVNAGYGTNAGNWAGVSAGGGADFASAGVSSMAANAAAFADGGVADKGPMISIFGESGPEAFIPMRQGYVPLSMHSDGGVSAALPGGRHIPAKFYSEGGTSAGIATRGAASSFAMSPMATGSGRMPDDHQPGMTITVPLNIDGKKLAEHTVTLTKGEMRRQIHHSLRPGGDGRRQLGRVA